VQQHASHPVPFTLGDIELDAGPIVRAELSPSTAPCIGGRMVAVITGEGDSQRLQFAAAAEGAR
jgi:hypothetical protein